MRTIYESRNATFSESAHLTAQTTIYPQMFNTAASNLSFEDVTMENGNIRRQVLDGEMGVDRIVKVTCASLRGPLTFTVQERFRRPEYAHWQDMTITEWNGASNLPSELYKINAGLFVYGYYDEHGNTFADAICVHVSSLLYKMATGSVRYIKGHNKKQQDFVAFKFKDLHDADVVAWRLGEDSTLMVEHP